MKNTNTCLLKLFCPNWHFACKQRWAEVNSAKVCSSSLLFIFRIWLFAFFGLFRCVKWGWQAYRTPTARGICTFAAFFSVFQRPFSLFTLVYEGHSVLCYKKKIEPLDRVMANFKRFWVWHLYNLRYISALFWLFSIAIYFFKSSRICSFEGQNMTFTVNVLLTCIRFCIVTPGPAVIRSVCNYSRQILIAGIIFALLRFSSDKL